MLIENIINFFKKSNKKESGSTSSKETAKERLHLVLMQDRANVSVDFLDLMRQEIIEVIKKYIDIDEKSMDVRLTNQENEDGTQGAPALYANIPIINIKEKTKKLSDEKNKEEYKEENNNKDNKHNKDKKEKNSKKKEKKDDNKKVEEKIENKEKENDKEKKSEEKITNNDEKKEEKEKNDETETQKDKKENNSKKESENE